VSKSTSENTTVILSEAKDPTLRVGSFGLRPQDDSGFRARSKRPASEILLFVYGGSVLLHAALAVGAILLPKSETKQAVAIELHEAKRKKDPPKPPAPPPPPPVAPVEKPPPASAPEKAQAKVDSTPKATDALPPVPMGADGFADLGMALGNDGPGIAVPGAVAAAAAATTAAAAPTATATRKVEQLAATHKETCSDPVVGPRRKNPVAPKYTLAARQAEIEGVVKVEVQVDETGHVISAHLVSGLGYGLDEAALAAARETTFEPASRCGRPQIGTTILPFRFQQT
jgi:protein TonB